MKKFLFLVGAMFMFALPTVNAQNVNTSNELAKLNKADLTLENPKKNIKASTWLAHGKAYTEAYILPTKEIGRGVPVQVLQMNVGEPKNMVQGEFQGAPVVVLDYEYVDIYVNPTNYLIEGWNQKKSIKDNLAVTAIASLTKAYEMDPKLESKIAAVANNLANALMQQGDALNSVSRTMESAECFELAYRAQKIVPSTTANGDNIFNAGMLVTMYAAGAEGEEALNAFLKGQALFEEVLATGYTDANGHIYYYLFHCYYGQKSVEPETALAKAKEALLTGIKLFPKNNTILDGLMQFYTAEQGVGDPAELTEMIEASLQGDPTNYDLWFGRGRVYNAIKNFDECIKSFEKCAELRPEAFDANFYLGYFIIEKANDALNVLNSNSGISYDEYEAENAKINLIYAEAITWLERANEINPSDVATIEYLNSLCFRLRDLDGMMDKYNKYHELFMQTR